jgi:hypothetical protein
VSNSRGETLAQQVHYEEIARGRVCSVKLLTGQKVVVGDRVGVDRDGWRDKIGTYLGKDYAKNRLKVRFDECGGALLLCYARELRWISVVGSEQLLEVQD